MTKTSRNTWVITESSLVLTIVWFWVCGDEQVLWRVQFILCLKCILFLDALCLLMVNCVLYCPSLANIALSINLHIHIGLYILSNHYEFTKQREVDTACFSCNCCFWLCVRISHFFISIQALITKWTMVSGKRSSWHVDVTLFLDLSSHNSK